jgi:hypothetical protein
MKRTLWVKMRTDTAEFLESNCMAQEIVWLGLSSNKEMN